MLKMAKIGRKCDVFWEAVLISLFCLQQIHHSLAQVAPVNVALNKPILARITCGLNSPESFYAHIEISKPPGERLASTCDASDPALAHGPENMVDQDSATGEVYTWWQSASRNFLLNAAMLSPDTEITIDLQEAYLVETIRIQMGDSVRPQQMGVFKSTDGIAFTPWEYKVSLNSQCSAEFSVPSSTSVSQASSVLCTRYSINSQPRNEVILFDFSPPTELIEWQRAKYVRFNFYNMPISFGIFSDDYHHYTVRNIDILAKCECNGHASDCILQPLTDDPTRMTYRCECGGNTQGSACDQCLPFYNQFAYQTGEGGFTCQECNCFGHSDVCTFNAVVARDNSSLDANGNYNGGGVCQGCRNFTAGINCHECERFYFRPPTKLQTDEDACSPCNCFLPGTREDANIGLVKGECLINNETPNPNSMVPGECYCKVNVQGIKCDQCKDGFYDLVDANSNGCLSCNCFTPGTVATSNICNKNATGQCPCKPFTTGRRCEECMDGYYDLTSGNSEGCLSCGCDAGGARSATCNKMTGDCTCRDQVEGRQCSSVSSFAYYQSLHSVSAEFESIGHPNWGRDSVNYAGFSWFGYVTLTGQMTTTTTLTVPPSQLSGRFEIVLRAANEGGTQLDLTISPRGATSGTVQRGTVSLPLCASWCYDGRAQNLNASLGSQFVLGVGEWDLTVSLDVQGGASVLFDKVVAIPVEFLNPVLLGDDADTFSNTCDVYQNDMRIGTSQESFCLSSVFTLTTYYFDGARLCNCNPTGSITLQCDQYGGQCQCKSGVGGRTCDMCLPEYYAYRSTGCTPCNCFGTNKVCDMTTGLCDCPPNTAGQQCDKCVIFAWGLDSTNGCQMCNCDPIGSINPQCDLTTGSCTCQPGVGGIKCNECLDEYKVLTSDGCTACQCDLAGSQSAVCNKTTGQCQCKDLAGGLTCSDCAADSFYNSPLHQTGCLQCVCMGITTVCDSTLDRAVQYDIPTDVLGNWSVTSAQSLFPNSPTASVINSTAVVTVLVPASTDASWSIPSQYLSGNLLGLYGSSLKMSLYYTLVNPLEVTTTREARLVIRGLENTFIHSLGTLSPQNVFHDLSVTIRETAFLMEGTNAAISRGEFLKTLSDVRDVSISASLTDIAHHSSIGQVSFSSATMFDSAQYDPQAMRALSVEQCSCGNGYTGYSCEECAMGYSRVNVTGHAFFGECTACDCNGHSQSCDATTGQCLQCMHNTTGFNCEICADGYHGEATLGTANDCTVCPCSPPRAENTTCSVIEGTVTCSACSPGHLGPLCDRCDTFHYGQPELSDGFCTPCSCNGNTDQCDSITGQCLGCGSRTVGFNCERCQDFTYGDASLRNCQDCNCDSVGSTGFLCNHTNGQCPCQPGIGDRRCSTCLPNYYSFTNQGCQACECNEYGSLTQQCDNSGVCSCRSGVQGIKCNQCVVGKYGLPHQACADCDCDVTGSVGGATAVCEDIDGQCPCKLGVGSRRCGECLPTYVNFTDTGCSRCDQCVETLQNSTVNLFVLWNLLWGQASLLNDLQQRDVELEALRPQVNATVTELTDTLTSFDALRVQIEGIDEQQYVADVNNLVSMVGQAMENSQTLLNQASVQLERIQVLQAEADAVLLGVHQTNQTVLDYINTLIQWGASSQAFMDAAAVKEAELVTVSFDSQDRLIQAELTRSLNLSRDANALIATVSAQALESNTVNVLVSTAQSQLLTTGQLAADTQSLLDSVEATLDQVNTVIMQTEVQLNYSSQLLSQSRVTLQRVGIMLAMSNADIADGDQAFLDANIIRQGSPSGTSGIPVDTSINQKGFNGWIAAESAARAQIQEVQQYQPSTDGSLILAENHLETLTTQAQESTTLFAGAQTNGQQAVEVIKLFQDVVSSITEAESTSQAASSGIQTTLQYVNTRTLEALQSEAQQSKDDSMVLETEVTSRSTDVAALEQSLQTANETLVSAEELWNTITANHVILQQEASALSQIANDPQIQPAINQGLASANSALETSVSTLNSTQALQSTLATKAAEILAIQDTNNMTTSQLAGIPAVIDPVESDLTILTEKTDLLVSLRNETTSIRSVINERMARLREKLRSVQNKIADSKQPARFLGQTSLEVQMDLAGSSTLSNEVQVKFKADSPDGLVFLVETPQAQHLSVELVEGKAQFSFDVSQDTVTISSPIEVCCGEWYHLIGTRYANEGHLSVVKLSTGGASTNYGSSLLTYDKYFSFPVDQTSFYIGGIPTYYQTSNVRSRYFTGCVSDMMIDKKELNLWRPSSQQGSTSCCEGAVLPVIPQPDVTPGASFSGFGYYQIPNDGFDVYQGASVSMEFQTSLPESVLFLVTRPDLISYIGIFMEAGNVIFEMNTAGNARYILRSRKTYNDARWYQVNVAYNTSHYSMDIRYANQTDVILESYQMRTLALLSFTNLRYAFKLILGSPDPSVTILRGPTSLRFAGCMRNILLSNGASSEMVSRPLNDTTAVSYDGVTFDGCKGGVAVGVGFSRPFAFAKLLLPNELSLTQTISFNFKTTQPHGILAYSYGTRSFNKLFYIALYHGNVFVQYNIGEGLSEPLQTVGLRLNTGQWQTVGVQFIGLSASLKVNDLQRIYSMRHLPTNGIDIQGPNSFLYVGGVPHTTPVLIGGEFPVRESLSGDLRDFSINSRVVNFNDGSILRDQNGLDLSGVTPPVSELPPLPYPSQPSPSGSPPPASCSAPTTVIRYPGVVRFGSTESSYQAYRLDSQQAALFSNSFVIVMSFRAISANGVLLYAANSNTRPRQFMGLVMMEGKLSFNILTDSRAMTGLNIQTENRYDNGEWQEVTILRINDFVAILVEATRDYTNNQVIVDSVTTSLSISTDFYIGGMGPLVAAGSQLVVSKPFDGCIRMMKAQFDNAPDMNFDLSNPNHSQDVQECSMNEVDIGGSFDGTGWLLLRNFMQVSGILDISMTVRTSEQNALLFAVSANIENFLAIDIFNGVVRAVVSHGSLSSYIVRSSSLVSEFDICDNQPHVIQLVFTSASLQLTVDSNPSDLTLFDAGTPNINVIGRGLYIGGIPDTTTVPLISGVATQSFQGCIQDLVINGVTENLRDNVRSSGFITGCPRPV